MLGRPLALALIGASLFAAPVAHAAAPVTIGTVADPPSSPPSDRCANGFARCTTILTGAPAPAAGVVVRWRVRATQQLIVRLRTVVPAGPSGAYTAVATGPVVTVPGDRQVHEFPAAVRIAAGGLLALDGDVTPSAYVAGSGSFAQVGYDPEGPTFDDGQTRAATAGLVGRLQLAADLEPDADGDGKGDLTQDRADLQLTGSAPAEVDAFAALGQAYTVHNLGPDAALGVQVTLDGAVVGGATPGCTDPGAASTCTIGMLAPGASVTVAPAFLEPAIFPPPPGPRTSVATVTSTTPDPSPADHTATLTTTRRPYVAPAPPPACVNVIRGTRDEDVLQGTPFGDRLMGNDGDDFLKGGAGDDCLEGGAGADLLDGGDGNDRLAGGSGRDRLRGGTGDDTLTGGQGNDQLNGGPGNDTLSPGDGRDSVVAGAGDDTINSRDGVRETIDCGAGRDTVRADRRDRLRHCEVVTRR